MFWKVYAVIYLVLIAVGLPPALNRLPHMSPIDAIDMLMFTPIALIGLWSAAFRHISLPTNTWKILLFGSVFWRAMEDFVLRYENVAMAGPQYEMFAPSRNVRPPFTTNIGLFRRLVGKSWPSTAS